MIKNNRNRKKNPGPYEDIVSLQELDAYETLIKYNLFN